MALQKEHIGVSKTHFSGLFCHLIHKIYLFLMSLKNVTFWVFAVILSTWFYNWFARPLRHKIGYTLLSIWLIFFRKFSKISCLNCLFDCDVKKGWLIVLLLWNLLKRVFKLLEILDSMLNHFIFWGEIAKTYLWFRILFQKLFLISVNCHYFRYHRYWYNFTTLYLKINHFYIAFLILKIFDFFAICHFFLFILISSWPAHINSHLWRLLVQITFLCSCLNGRVVSFLSRKASFYNVFLNSDNRCAWPLLIIVLRNRRFEDCLFKFAKNGLLGDRRFTCSIRFHNRILLLQSSWRLDNSFGQLTFWRWFWRRLL